MSVTSFAAGAPGYAGFKLHTTSWNTGTGTAIGAGYGFELLPSGAPRTNVGMNENNSIVGGAGFRKYPVKGTETFEGAFKANFAYAGSQAFFSALYGEEATSANGTGYNHLLTVGKTTHGVGNLAWTDNLVCHDIPSTKVKGITATWNEASIGEIDVAVLGRRELIDGSGSNTLSSMADATLPTQPAIKYLIAHSSQAVVRIKDASAGALGS